MIRAGAIDIGTNTTLALLAEGEGETLRPVKDSLTPNHLGEALTEDGMRAICAKYSACSGFFFTPHALRHTYAHRFLDQGGDIASLAQILGHENLNTTAIYTKRSQDELARMSENLRYE